MGAAALFDKAHLVFRGQFAVRCVGGHAHTLGEQIDGRLQVTGQDFDVHAAGVEVFHHLVGSGAPVVMDEGEQRDALAASNKHACTMAFSARDHQGRGEVAFEADALREAVWAVQAYQLALHLTFDSGVHVLQPLHGRGLQVLLLQQVTHGEGVGV